MSLFKYFRNKDRMVAVSKPNQLTADELYEQGQAFQSQDPEKAFQCYLQSAEMGYPMAMAKVGYSYLYQGNGVEYDIKKAAYWYEKAANTGYSNSMMMIAFFYMAGAGVEQSDDIAKGWIKKWINKAAESADERAVATAKEQLNDYDHSKLMWTTIFNTAEEMGGIPPK